MPMDKRVFGIKERTGPKVIQCVIWVWCISDFFCSIYFICQWAPFWSSWRCLGRKQLFLLHLISVIGTTIRDLVHTHGLATTEGHLVDPEFDIRRWYPSKTDSGVSMENLVQLTCKNCLMGQRRGNNTLIAKFGQNVCERLDGFLSKNGIVIPNQ